jgi:hypothetical protein
VTLGGDTRIVIEPGDEGLNVFSLIQIVNPSPAPVAPPAPLVFELPDEARGASMMEGSSPLGTLAEKRVTATGPFPPGSTSIQFAYSLPFGNGTVTISQTIPAPLDHVAVVAQKLGSMRLESSQIAEQRDMPAQGQTYIAARGPGPILTVGAWAAFRPGRPSGGKARRREDLRRTREKLLDELTTLETLYRREGIAADRYSARRRDLVTALERVYGEMDEDSAA